MINHAFKYNIPDKIQVAARRSRRGAAECTNTYMSSESSEQQRRRLNFDGYHSLELKKHVNAIHCSNNLTLIQRKLFNALLFNAYPELPHKQKFTIKGKDLCFLIGYNSKDTQKLKAALFGLITTAIEWNVIDCETGKENKWKASSILAAAELSAGICTYEYSQLMKELLYQPDIYGKINIHLVSQFKSSYGLALYENCIRYQGLQQTPWFSLDIFRKLMGVFDNKYLTFRDFKKRVLDVAVEEVNAVSSTNVIPEVERVNQKVTRIRFKLGKQNQAKSAALPESLMDEGLFTTLTDTFGFSQPMVDEIFAKYDESYIREKVNVILQSDSFASGKIRGLAGYLLEALKKDYKLSKSSKTAMEDQRKFKEAEEKMKKEKEESRVGRYNQYVAKKLDAYLAKLSQEQYQILLNDFENHLQSQKNNILQGWYKKHGLDHPATQGGFNTFLKETRGNQLGEILSVEDFMALIDESN